MPKNKNAQLRYKILDACFRNRSKYYYKRDLILACTEALAAESGKSENISERTIELDIKHMKSIDGYNAPVKSYRDGPKGTHQTYYRYEDPKFSIFNQPLSEDEIARLENTIRMLGSFIDSEQFLWFKELIPDLELKIGKKVRHEKVIAQSENLDLKGQEFFGPLMQAVINKQVLKIGYQDFAGKKFDWIFHPQYLKQYNERWYIFGLGEGSGYPVMNLALDRIINIAYSEKSYQDLGIDWDDYFSDIIGVTRYDKKSINLVEIKANDTTANYIKTKPLHETQKQVKGKVNHFSISVKPNYELETLLLSFGEGVEVVAPMSLRRRIKDRLKSALDNY